MKSENELTRRDFLKGAAAGIVVVAFPNIVTASNLMPIDSRAQALVRENDFPIYIDWKTKEIRYKENRNEYMTVKQLYSYVQHEMSSEAGISFPIIAQKPTEHLLVIEPQYTISENVTEHTKDGAIIELATEIYYSSIKI